MRIHKEGYKTILLVILLIAVVLLSFNFILRGQTWFHAGLYLAGLGFLLCIISFFRSPQRGLNGGRGKIICPADGKVVVIEKTFEPEYFKAERLQISIFMSARNVHINWFPVSGMIDYFYYHPGLHGVAFSPKASLENERATTVIKTEHGTEILVRQIAGAVARRIVTYPRVGEPVEQGDELGFIKFGSRVDLLLPLDTRLDITLNQKVTGKQTVIGYYE
ncbi:MAG TPA: phosphatidylserine decarboxylase family protein [Bacteroidales bacterium]|nr:phosphatidylserine decarboxylase family protein [Bacteroidales bacterium]